MNSVNAPRAGRRQWIGLAPLDIAREAFILDLHLTATISAMIAIGSAIMAVIPLRPLPGRSEPERQHDVDAVEEAVFELDEQEVENAA